MKLIGIDSGGTSCRVVLCDETGKVLANCTVPGHNPNADGFDALEESFRQGLSNVLADFDGLSCAIDAIHVGAAGVFDELRRKPGERRVLLKVAVLGDELRLLRERSFRDRDFFQHIVIGHGNAEIRIAFLQLVYVVPLVRIVDHINNGQQTLFGAVAHQKPRGTLHQFIEYAVIYIARRGHSEEERLPPSAH